MKVNFWSDCVRQGHEGVVVVEDWKVVKTN